MDRTLVPTLGSVLGPVLGRRIIGGGASSITAQVQALFPKYSAKGGMWDFTDMVTLFQDSARTVPVTAASQPVGGVNDISGLHRVLAQPTNAARPQYNGVGITLDGVDDFLATAANIDLASSSALVCVGLTSNSNIYQKVVELGPNSVTENGFALARGFSGGGDYAAYLYGSSFRYRYSQNFPAPDQSVVSVQYDIDATTEDEIIGRRDGSEWAYASGGGAAGSGVLAPNLITFGPTSGGAAYLNATLRRAVVIGAVLSADDRAIVEAWAGEGT